MEDAYEIGIRLVLENGVSAGVAALQHDLATYDRALAATTGRLRMVTEAGRRLAAPVGSDGAGPAVQAPAAEGQTPDSDAARGQQREAPVPAWATPLPAARPAQTTAVSARDKPPQSAVVAAPTMPRAGLTERASAPSDRALRVPATADLAVRAPAVQRDAVSRGREQAAVVLMAKPLPRYARFAPTAPAGPPAGVAAPDVPEGIPVSTPASDQQTSMTRRDVVRPSAWDVSSPVAAPASASPLAAPGTASTAAAAMPAAPMVAAASSGPAQGDVYLDGARVGRWMSDRLAREVDRPQAGVTGFDPRLGPAWPGSLHGT